MNPLVCPFCGQEADPDAAQPGSVAGTMLCSACGQEIDRPLDLTEELEPARTPQASEPIEPPGPLETSLPDTWQPPPVSPPLPPPDCDGLAGLADRIDPPQPEFIPWEAEAGFFARLWRTILMVLLHPVTALSRPARPGYAWPVAFAVILGTLGMCLNTLWARVEGKAFGTGDLVTMILSPLLVWLGLFIMAGIYHAFLWIVRGHRQGFRATLRAVAYAHAADIFYAIPVLGQFVGLVWGLAAIVGGLAGSQKIGKGRSFLAAIVLPLALLITLGLLIVVAVGIIAGTAYLDQLVKRGWGV